MRAKGLNMENIKQRNRVLILENIKRYGMISRKDLSQLLKLTPAALTLICTEMIKEGILKEVGEITEKRAGRKKILLNINYNYKYVFGINFEKDDTIIALSNLNGEIKDMIEVEKIMSMDDFDIVIEHLEDMLSKNKIKRNKISGIGIGMYGLVNPDEGIVQIKGETINAVKYFQERTGFITAVENNVRALALSEMFFSSSLKNFLFVKYGPGIGSCIVNNEEILYGHSYSAGEMGHMSMDSSGEKCSRCHKNGCLENLINFDKIIDKLQNDGLEIRKLLNKTGSKKIKMKDILKLAEAGDKDVRKVIDEVIDLISIALLNMSAVFDFARVVLFGEPFQNNYFYTKLRNRLVTNCDTFDTSTIILSKNKFFPQDTGGIFLGIKRTFYDTGGM